MKIFSKANLKRILSVALALFAAVTFCACTSDGTSSDTTAPVTEPAKFSIGVIQSEGGVEAENSYRGFSAAFTDKGYYQSEYYSVSVANCDGDAEKCMTAAEQYVSDGVDLIFAIGESAAVAAADATDTIPIVFSGVTDPIEAELLTSCEKPDKNATGVSDHIPVYEQFELLKKLLPEAKNISGIYMTTDEHSILVSTLAQSDAEDMDLEYTPYTAGTEKQLDVALENALEDCDALFVIEDEITAEYIDKIVKAASKKKIPVFSSTETLLEGGCLATCVPDYEEMGYNAGELALILLKGLHPVSELAVEYPTVCIERINGSVAESLSIDTSNLEDAEIIG